MVWFFFTALAIRLAVGLASLGALDADPDAYRRIANDYHETGTFGLIDQQGNVLPSAYRPPLYPWLLSWFQGFESDRIPVALLHAIFGAMTVALTLDIARQLGMTSLASLVSALLVLFDPILLRQSTLVMTETLATFLGVALWWLYLRIGCFQSQSVYRRCITALVLGALLGVACLCRPTSLAWCLAWAGLELMRHPLRSNSQLSGFQVSGCLIGGCLIVLLPWSLRNQSQIGQRVWTTTHGGYTLLLANNPILYEHWDTSYSRQWEEDLFHHWWAQRKSEHFGDQPPTEITSDALANRLGWTTIRNSPARFIKACAIREAWLWAWWPSNRQAGFATQLSIGLWYGISSIAALGGCLRLIRGNRVSIALWIPALALAISLCLVHAVYWSNMRMRAPMIPFVSLLVCYGCNKDWFGFGRSSHLQ